jgi:hypothetical protein
MGALLAMASSSLSGHGVGGRAELCYGETPVRQRCRCKVPSKEQDYHKTRLSCCHCHCSQYNPQAHRFLGVRISLSTCLTGDGQSSLAMDMRHLCVFYD